MRLPLTDENATVLLSVDSFNVPNHNIEGSLTESLSGIVKTLSEEFEEKLSVKKRKAFINRYHPYSESKNKDTKTVTSAQPRKMKLIQRPPSPATNKDSCIFNKVKIFSPIQTNIIAEAVRRLELQYEGNASAENRPIIRRQLDFYPDDIPNS